MMTLSIDVETKDANGDTVNRSRDNKMPMMTLSIEVETKDANDDTVNRSRDKRCQ